MIDVGINRTDAGLAGDVDFEAAAERAAADHARARRRRADDDRDAAAQHAAGGEGAGGAEARPDAAARGGRSPRARRSRCSSSMFLDWYDGRAAATATGLSAWEAFTRDRPAARRCWSRCSASRSPCSRSLGRGPALPVAIGVITATLALAAALLVLYRILNQPGPNDAIERRRGRLARPRRASLGVFCGAWRSISDERPRPADPPAPEPERRPTPART